MASSTPCEAVASLIAIQTRKRGGAGFGRMMATPTTILAVTTTAANRGWVSPRWPHNPAYGTRKADPIPSASGRNTQAAAVTTSANCSWPAAAVCPGLYPIPCAQQWMPSLTVWKELCTWLVGSLFPQNGRALRCLDWGWTPSNELLS